MEDIGIKGVELHDLAPHKDDRGQLTEIFRESWFDQEGFVQWNCVHSKKNVLRGVHLHYRHVDYLTVISQTMLIGLKDMRRESDTFELEALVPLTAAKMQAIIIPPGVAHGFYSPEDCSFIYGVSSYFAADDELGMSWTDPRLSMFPRDLDPHLSEKDKTAGSYEELLALYESRMAGLPTQ